MINPQWLELPMSRTNFHGPKYVRAIEVRLHVTNQGNVSVLVLNHIYMLDELSLHWVHMSEGTFSLVWPHLSSFLYACHVPTRCLFKSNLRTVFNNGIKLRQDRTKWQVLSVFFLSAIEVRSYFPLLSLIKHLALRLQWQFPLAAKYFQKRNFFYGLMNNAYGIKIYQKKNNIQFGK